MKYTPQYPLFLIIPHQYLPHMLCIGVGDFLFMALATKYLHIDKRLESLYKFRRKEDVCKMWFFFFYILGEKTGKISESLTMMDTRDKLIPATERESIVLRENERYILLESSIDAWDMEISISSTELSSHHLFEKCIQYLLIRCNHRECIDRRVFLESDPVYLSIHESLARIGWSMIERSSEIPFHPPLQCIDEVFFEEILEVSTIFLSLFVSFDDMGRLLDLATHPSLRMHESEAEFFVRTDEVFFCRHRENMPLL